MWFLLSSRSSYTLRSQSQASSGRSDAARSSWRIAVLHDLYFSGVGNSGNLSVSASLTLDPVDVRDALPPKTVINSRKSDIHPLEHIKVCKDVVLLPWSLGEHHEENHHFICQWFPTPKDTSFAIDSMSIAKVMFCELLFACLFGGWNKHQTYSPNGGWIMVVYHGRIRKKITWKINPSEVVCCMMMGPVVHQHSKNLPTYPWNIPQTQNQQFMKEFLSFGGLGRRGVCSRGMLGFS